jgi:hypothetical protein
MAALHAPALPAHEERGPVPRDPDLPAVSDLTAAFFAAGALVVVAIALIVSFG